MNILIDVLMYLTGGITGALLMCILQVCREDDEK